MDTAHMLIARGNPNGNCTLATCPVSDSIYGYRPNLAATIIFLVLFATTAIVYTWQGLRSRTWFFSIAMLLGSVSEVIGYISKMLLWHNPFSGTGFKISIVMLTFAPAFYSAGIYYTLKHICLTFGSDFSRLRPKLYTWIFISCDLLSIVLQGIGGGVSSASTDDTVLSIGADIMIAGLAFQVITLVIFGLLAADYARAVHRNRDVLNPATEKFRSSRRFRYFLIALTVAYFGILIRCAYRVAELSNGWQNNPILRMQDLFICLDSLPVGIAAVLLNIWHPGWCFPQEHRGEVVDAEKQVSSGEESS